FIGTISPAGAQSGPQLASGTSCSPHGLETTERLRLHGSRRARNGPGTPSKSLFMRYALVMFAQQVVSEIVFKIAPDSVNVVRVVLRIVVFHQESRALHAIVMARFRLHA